MMAYASMNLRCGAAATRRASRVVDCHHRQMVQDTAEVRSAAYDSRAIDDVPLDPLLLRDFGAAGVPLVVPDQDDAFHLVRDV